MEDMRWQMTYHGRIKNGVALLETPIALPDGTRVRVEIEPTESEFWNGKTVEELAGEQGVKTIGKTVKLAMDWPDEESVEDLMALVREVRH